MTSPRNSSPPQIAVWYFVGATFIFAAPVVFFPESPPWVRIATLALGFVLIVVGGVQLGREITQRRDGRNPPSEDPMGKG